MPKQLDILNHVLRQMMEEPVSSVDSTLPSAQIVMDAMGNLNRSVQTRGWWFNTDYDITLARDENNKIRLPDDMLDMATPIGKLWTQRGKFLYDPTAHSYVFTDSVVLTSMTTLLDVDDTPEPFSLYIQYELAYRHHVADDGDENKANRLLAQAHAAWSQLVNVDLKHKKVNAINRPQVASLLSGMRQRGGSSNPNYIGG